MSAALKATDLTRLFPAEELEATQPDLEAR